MDYRAKIQAIRGKFLRGEITLEKAEQEVEPLLVEMNLKAEKIAKQFGRRKPSKLTFSYVFR